MCSTPAAAQQYAQQPFTVHDHCVSQPFKADAVSCPAHQVLPELQVYICELGRCLLKLKDSADRVLELRMQQLTVEAISLVGHRLLRNPASHSDLATGQMNQDQAKQHKLDANFYKNLLVGVHMSDV